MINIKNYFFKNWILPFQSALSSAGCIIALMSTLSGHASSCAFASAYAYASFSTSKQNKN